MSMRTFDEVLPEDAEINLYAPQLPDSNTSVAGADCGIAKAFYDLRPDGATVIIHPVLAQQPLDTFSIHVNGQMRVDSQQAQSTNDTVTLHIPKNLLRSEPGFVNELTYTVKRTTGAEENYELPLTILYNAIRPGMEDQNGDEGHSELELVLPGDVLQDGIDADRAALGVQVYFSYPYCRAYDRIQLSCNGHDVYREVHPDEAPAAPTSVPTRIGLLLKKTDLEAAGDHLQFSFSYTVNDQIGNSPDLNSPWSAPIRVVVDLKGTRMAAPDIAEDPDDPYDAPDTIDLKKLGSKDLTVQVHVLESRWAISDTVRVTYRATPGTGAVVEHVVEELVGRLPFVHKLMIPNAKVIADSAIAVTCQQVRGGEVTATSKVARARVIVKPVILAVKNSSGLDVQNGGTVSDNKVVLSGGALAGMVLRIFDGDVFIEEVQTGANYKWQSKLLPIAVGQHSFTVKEKSGNQLESDPWLIERLAFSIHRAQMKLHGFSVKLTHWPKTGEDSIGNAEIRKPTGGVPPYDYASSDSLTASVTETGKVVGLKRGVATIYVTDQEGTALTYLVSVENVFKLQVSAEKLASDTAIVWMNTLGGQHTYNYIFTRDLRRVYVVSIPEAINSCVMSGRYYIYMGTDMQFWGHQGRQSLTSWCLTPL
ncbi:Ig-like domain-containing protein [Pseudomonas hamedanensis]|uniref:Ig-like domain-containing protein n=1 Tax=Pseudomonas hamedanensis TaxID=2745504 RepID=A0A9E6P274_9PSED|nr:Ig-like domain-containing protein [Pseudomonas hamedanensis]QXI18086.1 Ig-like domain-containing protein [Pseudomonas hamedanensis]